MSYLDDIPFIHGLDLCERFFFELVKPLLDKHYPTLEYTACRLGPGSDVLGFDTVQSRDHDWGPKFDILLENDKFIDELNVFFKKNLREKTICGYSTQFQACGEHDEQDKQVIFFNVSNNEENTCHGIRLMTMQQFFLDYLNWTIENGEPTVKDWLTFPSQHLLTIARGRVFHDSKNIDIKHIQSQLAYYPKDVWLYLISCCWERIGQEEHLMGRAGQVSDELGSSLIASRLVRDIMRLVFLLEKQFYPYAKWFGTAFRQWTTYGAEFEPFLRQIQLADTWQEREHHFNIVYERLATITKDKLFNKSDTVFSTEVSLFHDRPFQVINGGAIGAAIFAQIENEDIRQLPKLGSIDLFIDSTDALLPEFRLNMKRIFE